MKKLFFNKLHTEITRLEKKIQGEKISLHEHWNALKKRIQTPQGILVFLVSGAAIGYFLTQKKHSTSNKVQPPITLKAPPQVLPKILDLAIAFTPLALSLLNTHLALEKKTKTGQNAN